MYTRDKKLFHLILTFLFMYSSLLSYSNKNIAPVFPVMIRNYVQCIGIELAAKIITSEINHASLIDLKIVSRNAINYKFLLNY